MKRHFLSCFLVILSTITYAQAPVNGFTTDDLIIQKVSGHVYNHITYFKSETFGKVPCNGMIVFDKGEAVIFDTPVDDSTSSRLIGWISDSLHCKVKAIIATHFHVDCVGGLKAFHEHGIPSYASNKTIAFTKQKNFPVPQNGFDDKMEMKVGKKAVVAAFYGEGHTRDNIIGYFPSEKVMFGGCLIKELNAGKGNLEDANEKAWPETVTKIKTQYPDVQIVMPGHGKIGGTDLLDYTVKLFSEGK